MSRRSQFDFKAWGCLLLLGSPCLLIILTDNEIARAVGFTGIAAVAIVNTLIYLRFR